jgi:hypothetical protein
LSPDAPPRQPAPEISLEDYRELSSVIARSDTDITHLMTDMSFPMSADNYSMPANVSAHANHVHSICQQTGA